MVIDSQSTREAAPGIATSQALLARYLDTRRQSRTLVAELSAEDACVQSMPDASPAKWHLAHVTWFFETFVLEQSEPDFKSHHPAFRELYNSYYNGIGAQFSRPHRGLITRPSLTDVTNYRDAVDSRVCRLIEAGEPSVLQMVELGLQHEQQHQELLLMDIKHLFSCNPLAPAYSNRPLRKAETPARTGWQSICGGIAEMGASGDSFCFDNETPRHRHLLYPFALRNTLITNGEYLEFMQDGGYGEPLLWLADGWSLSREAGWTAPLYWRHVDGEWFEFTLHGLQPLDPEAPVCHISYYEADAYAQWASARLPTEFEWEAAACSQALPDEQEFGLHPHGAGAGNGPIQDLFGAVWQWTRSAYLPYPGFEAAAGAVGEYNGKFMSGQQTLRGSACITPVGHARLTYRNFFYPHQRWPFCGLRLARDES
ncbi:MAG: ergothioneine biosynthesis protein EgtB [Gammaproteobacteria bacterium]